MFIRFCFGSWEWSRSLAVSRWSFVVAPWFRANVDQERNRASGVEIEVPADDFLFSPSNSSTRLLAAVQPSGHRPNFRAYLGLKAWVTKLFYLFRAGLIPTLAF